MRFFVAGEGGRIFLRMKQQTHASSKTSTRARIDLRNSGSIVTIMANGISSLCCQKRFLYSIEFVWIGMKVKDLHFFKQKALSFKKIVKKALFVNVFKMAAHRMAYAAHGVKVSSENLANLHTPGYKARHLKPFQEIVSAGLLNDNNQFPTVTDKKADETLTGNTVSYKEELQLANSAQLTHTQMGNVLTWHLNMLRMALES